MDWRDRPYFDGILHWRSGEEWMEETAETERLREQHRPAKNMPQDGFPSSFDPVVCCSCSATFREELFQPYLCTACGAPTRWQDARLNAEHGAWRATYCARLLALNATPASADSQPVPTKET